MSRKILVVEDELVIADQLALMLEECGYEVAEICSSAEEAIAVIQQSKPDILLLDIHLKGEMDGVDLAQLVNAKFHIPFFFISSDTQVKTIARLKQTEPLGFIFKPFKKEDIMVNLEIALHQFSGTRNEANENSFFIKDKHTLVKVDYNEIIYAEAMDNYCLLYTEHNKFILPSTLKSVEDKLSGRGFFRAHRSYLINESRITSILPKAVLLGKKEIPLSESARVILMEKIRHL